MLKWGDERRTLSQYHPVKKIQIRVSYGNIWTNGQITRSKSDFENDKEMCQLMVGRMWRAGE